MKNKIVLTLVFISFGLFFTNTVFADTNINLQIKTNDSVIYDGNINVTPCDSEGSGELKATPYCAIVQSGTPSVWSGLWVDSIGGVLNNDGGNGLYWMWLANLSIDNCPTCSYSLSGKQYELQNNDKILFYYNTNPLDITVDKENPKVGESIKITGKELGLDSFWNPVWNNALSGQAIINGAGYDLDGNGEFIYEIVNSDALSVKIKKNGFIDSKELNITPEEVKRSSGSSGSYIANFIKPVEIKKAFSIADALKFLENNQKTNGSFGGYLYTDWVAIGVAKEDNNLIKEKLIKYYKENNLESKLITDNERHAMALMSLNINPYDGTKINYIEKIIKSFDGVQFGEKDLYNDDIFALIVLKNAGYNENDEIINEDIKYLISKQEKDGSWGSIDMTAAYIEAMKGFEDIVGVNDSILKSKSYIVSNQKPDGGFENSSSTAWVLQSLFSNEEILKSEKYLILKQNIDGGIGDSTENIDARVWMTAYTIPAILHKSWGEILYKFSKQEIVLPQQVVTTKIETKKEVISKYKNKEIQNRQEKLALLQSEIITSDQDTSINKSRGFLVKVGSFWQNTKYSFGLLLDKLGF